MRTYIGVVESAGATSTLLTEMLLYRGDGEHIDQFDIHRTDAHALFGIGIYLTTDPDVAHDYTAAKKTHRVYPLDRYDPEARSVAELLRFYTTRLASEFNERAWKEDWKRRNGYDGQSGLPSSIHDRMEREMTQAQAMGVRGRWSEAVERVRAELPHLRVLKMTTGELRLVKRDRPAAVSVFDIPDSYLARTLHGDRPLSDDVLQALKTLWRRYYTKGNDGDLRDANENFVDFDGYVKNYHERGVRYAWRDEGDDDWWRGGKGENPTLDDLMNGTHAASHVFKDEFWNNAHPKGLAFIEMMRDLGYVGIEYDGGKRTAGHIRGGGGRRHRAFVFWNAEDLHRFRLPNAELPSGKTVTTRSLPKQPA